MLLHDRHMLISKLSLIREVAGRRERNEDLSKPGRTDSR